MLCAIVLSHLVAGFTKALLKLGIDSKFLADRVTSDLPHELV
jgi:hypothetical protein